MNALAVRFSGWAVAAAALTVAGAAVAQAPDGQVAPAAAAAIAASHGPASTPSLGSVPPLPKDVRSTKGWKDSVMAIKGEGAALMREADAEPWTLHDTDAWADRERAEAAPPPAVSTPEGDTAAFVAAMRARAMPPPRKR